MKRRPSWGFGERGASAMEFAIVAPVLFLLLIGVAQLGILFFADAGLQHALSEGARMATIYPTPSEDAIKAKIEEPRFGIDASRLTEPTITYGSLDGAEYADIAVQYTVNLGFVFFSTTPITLKKTRRVYLYQDS